jgi:drug/metabolite transporter (DMT)-like permease
VNEPTDSISTRLLWLGIGYCLLAALGYTAANICLRQLAEIKIDPAWVICIKETVAVALVGPWLLLQVRRGHRVSFPGRTLAVLLLVGLATQLAGNVALQWAFGVVGLAISMPVAFGAMLIGSAMIGMLLFGELLSTRSIVAVVLVIGSVAMLSLGAAGQGDSGLDRKSAQTTSVGRSLALQSRASSLDGSAPESQVTIKAGDGEGTTLAAFSVLTVLLGIGGAALAGTAYAGLGAAVRYAGSAGVTVTSTVIVVTGVGMVSLGVVSLIRLGPSGMMATPPNALAWMIASGLFNVTAFVFITKGLQLTTLVHANVLNASQVALGAAAGILLFHEPRETWLLLGIALMIAGIMLFGHPRRKLKE